MESEIKLVVPDDYRVPDLHALDDDLALTPLPDQLLDARYLDTASGTLLSSGATLRRRTGEGPTRWTLKLPTGPPQGDLLQRSELEVIDEGHEVPAALLAAAVRFVGTTALVEVAHLHSERRRWLLTSRGVTVGELADDSVRGECPGRRPVSFREIELEVGSGAPDAVVSFVHDALRRAGAARSEPMSKLDRVLRLATEAG